MSHHKQISINRHEPPKCSVCGVPSSYNIDYRDTSQPGKYIEFKGKQTYRLPEDSILSCKDCVPVATSTLLKRIGLLDAGKEKEESPGSTQQVPARQPDSGPDSPEKAG